MRLDRTERTGPHCRNCGAHVTDRFAKVFGDNDDAVFRCLACTSTTDLTAGAATDDGRRDQQA